MGGGVPQDPLSTAIALLYTFWLGEMGVVVQPPLSSPLASTGSVRRGCGVLQIPSFTTRLWTTYPMTGSLGYRNFLAGRDGGCSPHTLEYISHHPRCLNRVGGGVWERYLVLQGPSSPATACRQAGQHLLIPCPRLGGDGSCSPTVSPSWNTSPIIPAALSG